MSIYDYRDNFALCSHIKSKLLYGNPELVTQPRISVLMPVYSHSEYFEDAIESVLSQTSGMPVEIIVCDNNPLSDEPTVYQQIIQKINDPKILYYRNEENLGMFQNWNRCIELARAPWVTFCHDDDMMAPSAFPFFFNQIQSFDFDMLLSAHVGLFNNQIKQFNQTEWPHKIGGVNITA